MRKSISALLAGAMLILSTGIASAYVITYDYKIPLPSAGGYNTPYAGVPGFQVETFDSPLLWGWSGDYAIKTGSNQYGAAPAYMNPLSISDATKYIAVPDGSSNTTGSAGALISTTDSFNYFGLWWGSIDGISGNLGINNVLEFFNNGVLVETVTGAEVIDPLQANGSWTSGNNNRYVNLLFLPEFDSFELTSYGRAFEADNIAVGNVVPEPGTMLLFGIGMLAMAVYGKRRMNRQS